MIINTDGFGEVEIDEKYILHFPVGIYGFEDVKEYALLEQGDDEFPVMIMQSIHNTFPSFVVLDPYFIKQDFSPQLPKEALKELKATTMDNLRFLVIAVVPKNINEMTVNLKSPVVINIENNLAMQVILENPDYSVRHRVFEEDGTVK